MNYVEVEEVNPVSSISMELANILLGQSHGMVGQLSCSRPTAPAALPKIIFHKLCYTAFLLSFYLRFSLLLFSLYNV
jgi:hypothetical protein